jgi:cell division septation protein DedD
MLFKVVTVAVFAAVLSPVGAYSQSMAQIGGPAELPSASFKGLQYVDSRGCVFMRVESSAGAKWYPRVNAARKPVCGQSRPQIKVAADEAPATLLKPAMPVVVAEAPAPKVKTNRPPMETVASRMMPESKPRVVAAAPVIAPPAPTFEIVASGGPSRGQIGCYASAPVAEVVRLRNGGTAVMCTKGDGTTSGWRPPVYPAGSRPGVALRDPAQAQVARANTDMVTLGQATTTDNFVMPEGYRAAWTDDRLNPNRGKGTAQGAAAQARIWTEDVPSRLVADANKAKAARSSVTISTKSAVEPVRKVQAASGRSFVQVGTFGVVENANGAAARLKSLGLPVAKSKLVKGGQALQIVLAGPFGSAEDAQLALRKARQAGFGDAFLR